MRSLALEFRSPGCVALKPVTLAEPRPDQVVVRTLYSGISTGTEMLAYRGAVDPELPLDDALESLTGTFAYPFAYGYSCVGTVEASPGDPPTGSAVFCFHPHQGVLIAHPADCIIVDGVDPRIATLFPLVETGLQIALDAGPVAEQPVVVSGLGAVGILAAALLQRAGALVIGSEPKPWRRRAAEAFGIEATDPESVSEVVEHRTGGRGTPLVVESSGNGQALAAAIDLLAPEGEILVASWYGREPVALPLGGAFHRRRLSIRSTQVSTIPARLQHRWDFERRSRATRRLLKELPLKTLATHEFAFADAAEAFATAARAPEGFIHAALRYEPVA